MSLVYPTFERQWPGITNHPQFATYLWQLDAYVKGAGQEVVDQVQPCLDASPVDLYYLHQDLWAVQEVLGKRPSLIVDVGSSALLAGFFTLFAPTLALDIRPFRARVTQLLPVNADMKTLPFADESLEMLTSMCVIEHVGLGRYGGQLDNQGSTKAFAEIRRVIRPGGSAIFSVPLGNDSWTVFNAHRIFTKAQVLTQLPDFTIERELFLFPHPGNEEDMQQLKLKQYCVWCAHMVKD